MNHKKVQRLWRQEGLKVPVRRRRKRCGASTADLSIPDAPNKVWAVDFQFDSDETGRKIKIANLVDEHTRECLASLVERRIPAPVLVRIAQPGRRRARLPASDPLRQRPRVRLPDTGFLGRGTRRIVLHPARPPTEQWLRRIVQLPATRRMLERQQLLEPPPRQNGDRHLARRAQHDMAPLGTRLPGPGSPCR